MATREYIQRAIVAALKNNASIAAKVSARVYSLWSPGNGTTYPKILVGFIASQEPAEQSGGMEVHMYQVSVFTANRDVMEAAEIGALVKAVLHAGTLSMTGWKNHWNRETGARIVGIDDTGIAHYAADYLIAVTATS